VQPLCPAGLPDIASRPGARHEAIFPSVKTPKGSYVVRQRSSELGSTQKFEFFNDIHDKRTLQIATAWPSQLEDGFFDRQSAQARPIAMH
jgi:hypothetical protein